MARQEDNTETRVKIGDAINRKVVLTDYETDEVVDSVLDAMDGPALALSVLYEANDLLNAMRTVSEERANPMGATEWTLSSEVSSRLNRAIAYLDGTVPHPADKSDDDGAQENGFDLLETIEDHTGDLDSSLGVLRLAIVDIEGQDTDGVRAFYVLEKELRRIKNGLHDVENRMIRARGRGNWRFAEGQNAIV